MALLFLTIFGGGKCLGQTVISFNPAADKGAETANGTGKNDTYSKSGITLDTKDGLLGNGTDYRIYTNGTLTISSTLGNIRKIELTSDNTDRGCDKFSGSGYTSTQYGSGTWIGDAATVVLTASAQSRLSSITVTVASSKGLTTTTFGESIDNTTIVVAEGEESSFTAPTATLTPAEAGTPTYSSSNEAVATVNATTGAITFGTEFGITEITASYAGNDEYAASEAKYTIDHQKKKVSGTFIFNDAIGSFVNLGTGGYATTYNSDIVFIGSDSKEYTFTLSNAYKNGGGIQMKASSGKVVSPLFALANGYTVTVTTKTNNIIISSGELTVEGVNGTCTLNVPNNATFTITTGSKYAVVTEIEIIPNAAPATITLDESAANTITAATGATVNLVRTLGNTYWNTFCVPFAISAEQVTEVFGEGTVITTFDGTVTGTTMNFAKAESIEAGKAYLIKPANLTANPTFSGVDIEEGEPQSTVSADGYGFSGVYNPAPMKTDGTELFISKTGTLVVPAATTNTIKGMRAIVTVPDGISGAKLNIMGSITGIENIDNATRTNAPTIYSIGGQRMANNSANMPKGVYIVNGKKTIIK